MSVQFGRWNFDGKPIDRDYLERVKPLLAPYGPDDLSSHTNGNVSIVYCAFHTTKESRREKQPFLTGTQTVITWDGRLDNRGDLIRALGDVVTHTSTDASIIAVAYERWGSDCFARFIGDWALSIWDPRTESLILAKDPIGARHLYYALEDNQITWSTILDPLVLLAGRKFALCEEYVAGWFSYFPATHLTPYVGIRSVPPSCSVMVKNGRSSVQKYWDFDSERRIRYRTDLEYEEHFRVLFDQAVRRRLRSDSPVLAELSGGMDSSSIVCVADTLIARGEVETPLLDTISYYDDSEPNWNERPYFTKIEEKRGRTGCHIDVSKREPLNFECENDVFAAIPGAGARPSEQSRRFSACLSKQGNRVVLSGVGGDEVTGGVPTPIPELEDLLARARLGRLSHQLKLWALNKRRPWFHLLFEAARGFLSPNIVGVPKRKRPAPWLNPSFVKRNRAALNGYQSRLKLFGPLPTFQENVSTLEILRRQLESSLLRSETLTEYRYPYLDLDLLQFIYAAPRDQLVRPGQRRSLMRRALAGIVPEELLNRKRKAYVSRSPVATILSDRAALTDLANNMLSATMGIISPKAFLEAIQLACQGLEIPVVTLMRALAVELWLRNLSTHQVWNGFSSWNEQTVGQVNPRLASHVA